jgi:hypothetical protein
MLTAILIISIISYFRSGRSGVSSHSEDVNTAPNRLKREFLPFQVGFDLSEFIQSMAGKLNCSIRLKEQPISTTLNVRPQFWSLFRKRQNRSYIIRINNSDNFHGIRLNDVPAEAQIGLWYHELMHIRDYQSRSFWGLLERGLQYLTVNGRRSYEHEIDRMVIEDGYGDYLYQWSRYAMEISDASNSYKAYKASVYLAPEQIYRESVERDLQLIPLLQRVS